MDKEDDIINSRILLSHKKNKILPFTAIWTNLEGIVLNEIIHRERQTLYTTFMWSLKKHSNLGNITKQRWAHRHREQTSGCQWGEGGEEEKDSKGVG